MINIYNIRPKGFNIGNDVIHLALLHFLRNAFESELNIISLPATSKYESSRKAGLSAQTVYEINQFGDGLIVGGGNLYENGELEVNPIALRALEKPMMILSVSRGKIYNKELEYVDRTDVMPDEKIRLLNDKACYSLSRDEATTEYLNTLGINNQLGGCPTLFINEIPQHSVPISKVQETDVLISIRTPSLMSVPVGFQYQVHSQIEKMVETLHQNGYKNIKLLCHDHRDIPFAASFSNLEYLFTEDVYTYLTYLRNTKLNVTFRLHSFLPCLSYGIPTINISYDQRASGMLKTVGMDGWNIDLLKDNLIIEFQNRLDNLGMLNELRQTLKATTWNHLRSVILNHCKLFAEKINNN